MPSAASDNPTGGKPDNAREEPADRVFHQAVQQSGSARVVRRAETSPVLYVLSELEQIALLRHEWNGLLAASGIHNPFMTWEWIEAWYRAHRSDGDIHCLLAVEADRLVGLAPLFLSRRPDACLGPGTLGFASTFGHAWGFYLDLVASPGYEATVAGLIVEHLVANKTAWHTVKLARMNPHSPMLSALIAQALNHDLPLVARPGLRTMTASLPAQAGEFASWVTSSNRRKKTRRMLRRMQAELGPVELREAKDAQEFDLGLQQLVTLSQLQRQGQCNFHDPRFLECFITSSRRFWEAGWMGFHYLHTPEGTAAVSVDLLCDNCLYAMQPALDPHFAQYDPGHILMTMVTEHGIGQGARKLDMLPGGNYKLQYVQASESLLQVIIPGDTMRGLAPVTYAMFRRSLRKSARQALTNLANWLPRRAPAQTTACLPWTLAMTSLALTEPPAGNTIWRLPEW